MGSANRISNLEDATRGAPEKWAKSDEDGVTLVREPEGRPVQVQSQHSAPVCTRPSLGRLAISASANNVTVILNTATTIALPPNGAGKNYYMLAIGNNAFVCTDGIAVANAAGIVVPESTMIGPMILSGSISMIGATAAGYFYLIRVLDD